NWEINMWSEEAIAKEGEIYMRPSSQPRGTTRTGQTRGKGRVQTNVNKHLSLQKNALKLLKETMDEVKAARK
ncbi:hypothetical protein SK128_007023, partial [Halocaridina rubra]